MHLTRRSFALPMMLIAAGLGPTRPHGRPAADPRTAILVTPTWVHEHLRDSNLVLLHVGVKTEYDAGHLPGARFIDMDDLSLPRDPKPGSLSLEMLSPDSLRAHLVKFGVSNSSRVVVYFGKDWVSPSTRIVLTLQLAGLGEATSIMDGGMPAWVAQNYPTTADVPAPHLGTLQPLTVTPVVVTAEWVRDHLGKPGYAVVDARDGAFYDGVMDGGPPTARRKGHLPGAVSVPFDSVWTDRYELKSTAELRAIFAKAGVKPGDTIIGYCHVGQQATAMLFAARSLGYKTFLYDGSFEDWALRNWPVEVTAKGGRGR